MNKPFTEDQIYRIVSSDDSIKVLTNRLNQIALDWHKQQTRWIPVSERLPTKDDADEEFVEVWDSELELTETIYYDLVLSRNFTHWRRIERPE